MKERQVLSAAKIWLLFLVCKHLTRLPCWESIQQNFFPKNLHENGLQFPEERNVFVLDYQHGFHDVTCKQYKLKSCLVPIFPSPQASVCRAAYTLRVTCSSEFLALSPNISNLFCAPGQICLFSVTMFFLSLYNFSVSISPLALVFPLTQQKKRAAKHCLR